MSWRKKTLHSKNKIKRRRRSLMLYTVAGLVVLGTIIGGLAWVSYFPRITITDVVVLGADADTREEAQGIAKKELGKTYALLFSRANAFLYPESSVEQKILDTFPTIYAVELAISRFQKLAVTLHARAPAYLWCALDEECYFVDKEGILFGKSPSFSGNVYFVFKNPLEKGANVNERNAAFPLRARVLQEKEFSYVVSLKETFEENDIFPAEVAMDEEGSFVFTLANGARIFFNTDESAEILVRNLQAALGTKALNKEDITGTNPKLEYIDLRFKKRVYYKFKEVL